MEYKTLSHEFPPQYDRNSRILVLGSFPSVKSREEKFYYGHKQNRFWPLIAMICGEENPDSVEEKKHLAETHHIALWDVIDSCEIIGSSDASIKNVKVNDLSLVIEASEIQHIYLNGGKAAELYKKYISDRIKIPAVKLPSTSPANAAWNMDRLAEEWKQIREFI